MSDSRKSVPPQGPPLTLTRAITLLPFLSFLRGIGAPVNRWLTAAKLPTHALDKPDSLIPLRNCCRFLDEAAQREGIPNLGFLVGEGTQLRELGAFGLLISQSPTLWDGLSKARQLISTFNSGFRLRLEWQGDAVWIHHENIMGKVSGSQQADEFGLALIANLVRHATGPSWRPEAVKLAGRPYRELSDLGLLHETSLRYGQNSSALAIPALLLSKSLPATPSASSVSVSATAAWLESTAPARDLAGSVKQFLLQHPPAGIPDIRATAESSGLSVRTLQRRLLREGHEYSQLVDRIRFEKAVELLRHPEYRMVDIAQALGYEEAANFTRAFRRWTGITPMAYRKAAGN